MKKMLAAILALMLCFVCASAEGVEQIERTAFEGYAASFAEWTDKEWKSDDAELIQVISSEDGVTVSACVSEENLICVTVEFPCDQVTDCVRAVIGNLEWLSDEAVEQLFALEDDAELELEGYLIYRVHGENRDAFSICRAEDVDGIIWQPIHGGKKLHRKIECSGMDVSRMITQEAADLTGWEACERCNNPEQSEKEEQ